MWKPVSIGGWLDERIVFIENIISSNQKKTDENKMQISDCVIALQNFKYCKKLFDELLIDSNNNDFKKRFKNIANKLIFDTIYELDKQEYKCIYIHEFCFSTPEKEILPQEHVDNISDVRSALENIFCQVKKMCS